MAEERGKRIFTPDEFNRIISLVKELEHADKSRQKRIRDSLRKIGLYWSEVGFGSYTVANVQSLFENGTLRIHGGEIGEAHSNIDPISTFPGQRHGIMCKSNNEVRQGRRNSDEYYVIDLCDEILGLKGLRQYKFNFLTGDSGVKLPVDAYYPDIKLVVEYHESQHTESTPFFDKKKTVSGVSRGEQRQIYDQRRKELLPKHGIKLVIISYTDFGFTKRLVRNHDRDRAIVTEILSSVGILPNK